jgi:hypothetical protein
VGIGRGGFPLRRWDVASVLVVAGAFLGWKAALTTSAATFLFWGLFRLFRWRSTEAPITAACLAVVAQILCWRWLGFF